ncbi:MAG: baseplate J/gp47 family protein [Bilophila wadsworthia]
MVKINGLRRKPSGRSTVDLRLVGQAGTVIRGGMAGDAAGKRWLLPDEVAIPQSGEITVTATAEESGDIRAAAGDIVKILTPARGWQSVGNPAAALPGAAVETDAELRRRQAISTALPSLTVFEGTLGAVASIPGVTRSRGYENDGGVPDADGIPGHSICMVVEGGDTAAIAEAIAAKKGPGAGTYGTTEALVRDKFGVPNVIKFFRPVETPVYATVTIRPFPGYLSTTGESIRKNVAEHINGLNIGDDVSLSRLYSPANAANAASYDIESITLGTSQGAQSAANVAVAFNAVASCSVDRVKLVVRP